MVITYSDAILRGFVAQICRDIGWNASHTTSLEVLSQITSSYMRQLAKHCVQYANHCGRQKPTFDDIGLAFTHFNIDLNELKDYVNNVESTALEIPVPKFPIANLSNRVVTNTGGGEDRPDWYNEWLPPLRESESRAVGSTDESGETSKPNEDVLQDSMTSLTSTFHLAQELGSSSPKRATSAVDSFGLLRDLYTSVGQREGRLPDSQRIIESDESRDNSPERQEKVVEEKVKVEDKDKKKEKKKDRKELKEDKRKMKQKINKENSKNTIGIKAIISKDKIKDKKKLKVKKFLKIKDFTKRSYSPLSIKVTGLSTGTPTATSTPTMARSPSSVTSPDGLKATNNSFDSSIEAVIDRICSKEEPKSSPKPEEVSETPKKKYKLKKEDSLEKKTKRSKKDNSSLDLSMNETIDEVVRQSHTALLSPPKRSPHQPLHQNMSPKVKSETISMSSQNLSKQSPNVQTFDDDEAAKTLVLMAGDKTAPKRKKNKPSATATATATSASPTKEESNSSAFQSAMSSFPKVSPGVSPLSPTMFSMSNQNPFFPTPPLFGHMSPPLLTPMQTSPHESYPPPPPPPLTKPKTLAEKKALPPEIMNAPVIKKEKDKENKTDRKEREREKDREKKDKREKKTQKLKNKKFKSRKTISDDDSSSDEDIKPKINIKLGSTAKTQPIVSEKLSAKTPVDNKPAVKTLLSPKHNVPNQEELSNKKKRGPKKKPIKDEVKEDKSCIVIRETITVETGEGDGRVWICPACKEPDDGSPMIGENVNHLDDRTRVKITRSGLKY